MLYMVTFTINIPPMLAYIPNMDPMGNDDNYICIVIMSGPTFFLPINGTLINIYHEPTLTLAKNLGHDLDHDLFMKKNIIFRIHHFKSSICSIEINH